MVQEPQDPIEEIDFNALDTPDPPRSRLKTGCLSDVLYFCLWWACCGRGSAGVIWLGGQARQETAVTKPLDSRSNCCRPTAPNPQSNQSPHSIRPTPSIASFTWTAEGQMATIAPDGSDQRQISDTAVRFQFPAWSPTGEYVAALGWAQFGTVDRCG